MLHLDGLGISISDSRTYVHKHVCSLIWSFETRTVFIFFLETTQGDSWSCTLAGSQLSGAWSWRSTAPGHTQVPPYPVTAWGSERAWSILLPYLQFPATACLSPLPSHSLNNNNNKSSFLFICVPSWKGLNSQLELQAWVRPPLR